MAEPTWLTSSAITQPEPYKHLSTTTVSGSSTTNIVLQSTTASADDNTWAFYHHLFMIMKYSCNTSADNEEICFELNNDAVTTTAYLTNYRGDSAGYQGTTQRNGGGSSTGSLANIGGLGVYSTNPNAAGTNGQGYFWNARTWFYNINQCSARNVQSWYGGYTSSESPPSSDGNSYAMGAYSTFTHGLQNEHTYSASNTDYIRGAYGVDPLTEIDIYISGGGNFIAGTEVDLYGVFWKMDET
jgi:hypothetical protein